MLDARLAAIAVFDGGAHLDGLADALRQSNLSQDEQTRVLVQAWEAAVEGALEDGLFTLDEENALHLTPVVVPFAILARPALGQGSQTEWSPALVACSQGSCGA